MKRTLLAALLLPLIGQAQTTEFGNLNVVQNDAGNATTSVTVTKGAGSSPNFAIRTGSNKADYNVTFGNTNDYDTGVLVAAVSENGRNNNAVGETIGTFYTTVAVDLDSTTTPNRYYLALFRAPNAEEQNQNVACAFFPYSQWLGGVARNAANANGGATDTLKASTGINLGVQFTTAGAGVFGLNLTTINAAYTSQNGILLVSHLKNEDNYAASFVNGSGFTMHVRDNGSTGTTASPATEQDPIAFVYLNTADVGTKQLKAMGRVNSDASTDVSGGSFTVTKGGTGQWYLSIPGMNPATGTLIVSPEGGATNNIDNIISYQWDAANTRYVIESRDIVSTTAAPVLEDGATTGEDMFSFAFFEAPVAPTVAITTPANGSNVITGAAFEVEATAADANGTVTQVEFFRNGTSVGTDASAPFSFNQVALPVGAYSFTARATDNDGFTTTSTVVTVNVTLDPGNLPANTALWFDGVNDYVTMGTALDLGAGGPPTNGLTLECWFRKDGTGVTSSSGSGGVTAVPLFGKGRGEGDGSNVDCNYFFGITTAGILVADFEAYPAAGITSGQNYPITATNTPITNGVWNHAAVTYDGATATWTMYLNGTPVGTATAVAGALPRYDSIQHFGIGTAMTSTGVREGAFHGIIDEVRVWNYARSGAEIAATKDVAVTSSPGLVARYGLNEGIGTSTASSTGTSAGTLTNGALWIEGATLVSNDPPTVAITAPANNATFNAPAAFTINATASDPDGTISKVEFFSGATKLGEDTTAPYSFDVSGLAQGSYSYTARATDNFGAFANSSVINVTVEAPLTTPPTVSITAPADGATFLAPATITINANAADTDGTVAKVEFFNGATKLGEDMTSPYSFAWNNVAIGTYSLTAKATDDMTATTTSAVITVNVIANQAPTVTLASPVDLATNAGTGGTVTLSASVSDPESQPLTVTFYGRLKSPPVGPDFTLVTLPDTQFYSENSGGNRLQHFTSQTNWIVANRTTLNIPFVAHMGDMVQNGDAVQQEWINADSAMDIIEDPLTTLLTHGIPWGGAPGNHDQQPIGSPDGASLYWNTYFGSDRWAGRPYWGGNYSTNNDNNYQLFSASGLDFIVINLEYRSSASQAVLDWADALLKAHPNRRAIITSHWLIGTGNPAAWGGHGQAVYDNLKDNPNLFLMLCGHIHGEGQRADVFEGRTVYTVLQDYQSRANGGDSWLRYFTFSPANNTITAKTLQTRTLTFETDADSEFTLPYTMGAGTATWTALGTVNASGGSATLDWTGLVGSTEYEWYAAVSDGTNNVGSTARSFTTAANAAPTVSLTSPTEGASVVLPAQVAFEASAADSDGSVAKVEFFAGATKVGEDSTAPFSFAWTAISGSYALTAVATDNQGASTTSAVLNITVTNPANVPPTVSITSPVNGFSTENSSLTISATAADTDGTITKVEFFQGTTKLGEDTTSPFAYNWSGLAVGTYSLTAIATDNDGATTTSTAVSVTFTPPGNFLGSLSQDFDSMGTAGTTPPGTWSVWNAASGTGNSTWSTSVLATDLPTMVAVTPLTATTTPSANGNNGYNAANNGNTTNRALASAPTTNAGTAFQLLLTNGTSGPIDTLKIGFETLRYTSAGTANELPGYWLFFSLDGGTTWTNFSALNPTITTVPNTTGSSVTVPTIVSLGANWNPGTQLRLRWVDDNAVQTSPDQIIGLDNVTIEGVALDTSLMLTEVQSNQSATKPSTANDYWELTNFSGVAKDISGYTWHDNGRSVSAAQAWKLPMGTIIGAGESIIFTSTPAADFRAWWGLAPTVQVFQSTGAPGLGSSDGVSFFNADQVEIFFFNYAASGFTREDGSPSVGGHAGPSGGGSNNAQALIWVPASGTTSPRYTAATGLAGNHGSFTAVSPATDTGSPGNQGIIVTSVSIGSASVNEGNTGTTLLSLPVTRSSTATAFTVDYAVTGGTATSGTDYATLASGTLTFTNGGAASLPINITVNGDTTSEADETVLITLSNLTNTTGTTTIQSATGTGTIVNDDVMPTNVSITDASLIEGNSGTSTLSFTVTRSDALGAFTVDYATSSGNATSGSDFTAATGTLSFTVGGALTEQISVSITGDSQLELNETFVVTLSNLVSSLGSAILADATATGTITNDDSVPVAFPASNSLSSTVKGSIALAGAEIPAFDPLSDRAFASSGAGIQVVNLADPAAPVFINTITPSTLGVSGLTSDDISSVAVRKGSGANPSVLAAAVISNPKTNPGFVVFLNAATGALISHATVGVVPDHIAWTPDGSKLLVCNEGELPLPEVAIEVAVPDAAQGTVSIIAVDAAGVAGTVQTADFTAFDAQTAALKTAGVRIYDDGVPSTDFEPEYLAISPDGTKAMVTLQEANAVAVLDIASATFTSVAPLGKKNFSALRADFSDADGMKNPRTGQPVFGLYMPDAIAAFSSGGQTYYVTANEGDDRNDFIAPNETTTVNNAGYVLDPTVFPDAATLKLNANLGKLTVSNITSLRGDTDNDGDIDEILMYGARSFSILDSTGALVFDSGDMIEMIVASLHNSNFDDGRSDNKGPEPEGVAVATLGARTFAFVGLERSHMTLVFDVTNPLAPTYVTSLVRSGDLNPEGIVVVSESDSPSGRPLVLVTNESSNTLSVFELTPATAFTMQLLHLADAEAGLLASQTAPNLAALVDAFDGTYANTLILAGGDNYIPGPFAAAGTDALVAATHNKGNNPFAADIEIHNRLGVEASTVGNHEFDFGTNAFSDAILDTNFPYLTSNLNFAGDSGISARYQETVGVGGLEEASSVKNKIVPSCVVTKGTEKIGLVGVTTQIIEAISSTGGVEVKGFVGDGSEMDNMVLLASQVQPVINDLKSQGVNKIILMAHLQQIANELMLAPMLTDVDIILAAGSNTRLGDANDVAVAFTGHAANFAANYPIYTAGADGKPTVVVNTDNEFTYLGRLVADFDADGLLIVPNLLANTTVNGAYAATASNVAAAWGVAEVDLPTTAFASGTKGALVKQITDAVQGVITTKDGDVRGFTSVYLEGERSFVRNQETNLGNISADSMITVGKTALPAATHVVAMKNGGGIRAAIGAVEVATGAKLPPLANPAAGKPAGAISLLDIENSMRFNNGLMLCDTTPAGLKAILEHGVAVLGNQGRFPQIGGIRFSFNPSGTAGSRIQSIVTIDDSGAITGRVVSGGAVLPTAPATITLVTLNFLANGGDGYPFKANADNFRFLLNGGGLSAAIDESLSFTATGVVPVNILGEQAALSSHLQARYATAPSAYNLAETAPALDTRIQSTAVRTDTVLDGPATFASWLADNGYSGTAGGDTDNDGVPDSLEYFFNANPNSGGDRDNLPTVTTNGSDLEFRFTYLTSTVFPAYLQCSEDLIAWANATPGVDYEVITETVNGSETAVRFRIFCNPLPTTQGPFTYLTPFTTAVGRGTIDQLTITNHGMAGAGRLSGDSYDSFGETMGAASGLSITGWNYNSGTGQFSGVFNVLPDRGYNSGTIFSNYAARIHQTPFTFTPYYGAGPVPQTQIMPTYGSTTKFTYLDGATMKFTTGLNATAVTTIMGQSVGTTAAANGPGGATENLISFDAEAIHVFADGSGFVSDEYGTYIARFNAAKQFTRIIQLPAAAQPHKPVGTLNFDSTTAPTNGRRNNQGLEGMSVSPDNSRLFALMQSALVQDTGAGNQGRFNTRLFVYDIAGANLENPVLIGEYAVQLPRYDLNGNNSGLDTTAAQSEIVALSSTQLLMLPRDGNGLGKGDTNPPVVKTVDLVDFSAATNILGLYDAEGNQISPSGTLRTTITPARSTVVVNLLSSTDLTKFGFNTNTAAPNQFTVNEKAEGMALVPDTSTASTEDYFLFVANDNDFQSSDVRMIDAAGNLVSYGDARDRGITNDAVFTAWRITICPNNKKFFRIQVDTAP